MILLQLLYSAFFWMWVEIGILLIYLFSFPLAFSPSLNKKFIGLVFKLLLRFLFGVCFIRVKVFHAERIPRGEPLVFIANHPGWTWVDSFYLYAYLPADFRLFLEEVYLRIPLLGRVLRVLDCIGYERRRKASLAQAVFSALQKKDSLLVFPENPAEDDKLIATFLNGPIRIAKACGVTLVPAVVKGGEKVSPKESFLISPGEIRIYIDQPIRAGEYDDPADKTRRLEKRFKEVFFTEGDWNAL